MALENTAGRGVLAHYGPRSTDEHYGGEAAGGGKLKHAVFKFSYDNLPVNNDDGLTYTIPQGVMIKNVYVKATTDFASGTSYDIGLEEADGTVIDLDGLFDALTLAEINVGDDALSHGGTNSGVLLNLETTAPAQLIVVETGTFTAGEAELVIEYIEM